MRGLSDSVAGQEMPDEAIYGVVLLAALAHALWNAMLKASSDRLLTLATIRTVGLVIGCMLVFVVPMPAPKSWPFLIAAIFVHYAYYACMLGGYRVGDLSQVYPIARGLAPLLVAGLAASLLGEHLTVGQLVAVLLTSTGIVVLAFNRGAPRKGAVPFAVATGVTIAGYTFLNGLGVRLGGTVLGYLALLEIGTGSGVLLVTVLRRHAEINVFARMQGLRGIAAGFLSVGGYLAGLWAIALLPMGPVTAVRETSVVFGAIIGVLVLRESLGPRRIAAACLVATGIVALTLLGA
jgi:drug/metabolite transporter (DMT)-like permease